ncbi:MAG TPA: hypothetical protein VJ741_08965 [Solirubrobacteraceae bacterium]|nr:hypothetical protein [Solirubrobacteraceae bacterium]
MNEQPTLPPAAAISPQNHSNDLIIPAPAGWPAAPDPAVYHGLPGAIVHRIAPHTEADPVAILTQLLIACGALIGRGAHYRVEATLHHPNEFLLLIGDSSRARKGGSYDHVTRLLAEADPALPSRLRTGLASGEGLVWAVRDPNGQDPGVSDKRLLIAEPEFASVLKQTQREINTLSPVLRSGWDGRPLALLTRTAPARATNAHISIIGHITQTELRRHATTVELANGFLNRFVLAVVRRVRMLPEGGDPEPLKNTGLVRYLTSVLKHAHTAGQVKLDDAARELWWQTYPQLTHPGDGLIGHLTARAEAHTIRLALLYALLDGERRIQPPHLQAALALWDFAARSANWALNNATGDPLAEQIHAALERSPNGLTRTQISHLLHRNLPADQLQQALHALAATGRAHPQKIHTAGRPTELWTARPPRPT